MATQTTNYGLTMPSYNEVADIEVINDNMNLIDAQMKKNADGVGQAKSIVSDAYSGSLTYNVGDYCIYENKLYRCITAVTTGEAFDSAKWKETSVKSELSTLNSNISLIDIVNLSKVTLKHNNDLNRNEFVYSVNETIYVLSYDTESIYLDASYDNGTNWSRLWTYRENVQHYTLTRSDVNNINCVAHVSGNVVTLQIWGGNNIELATKNEYAYIGTLPNNMKPQQTYIKKIDYITFKGQLTIHSDGNITIGYTDIDIPANYKFWATETFVI